MIEAGAGPVLLLLARVTIVLGLAWAVAACLRGTAAKWRDVLWLTALVTCLSLPILSPVLPTLDVAVPEMAAFVAESESARAGDHVVSGPASRGGARDPTTAISHGTRGNAAGVDLSRVVNFLWVAGALLVLLSLVRERWRLGRLRRGSRPVRAPTLERVVAESAAAAGLSPGSRAYSRVDVRVSDTLRLPVTWGTVRPILLLPVEAASWPERRLRAVLTHEFTHVRRRDHLRRQLGVVCLSLYWFHPLLWLAVRRLRAASERACDDQVLSAGFDPVQYAEDLVALARNVAGHRIGLAPGLAGYRKDFERRVRSLLSRKPDRGTLPPVIARTAVLCSGILACTSLVAVPVGSVSAPPRFDPSDQPPEVAEVTPASRSPEPGASVGLIPQERVSAPAWSESECWRPDHARDRNSDRNEELGVWTFEWESPTCLSRIEMRGRLGVSAASGELTALDPDTELEIVERDRGLQRRLVVQSATGVQLRVRMWTDGERIPRLGRRERAWLRDRLELLREETHGAVVEVVP